MPRGPISTFTTSPAHIEFQTKVVTMVGSNLDFMEENRTSLLTPKNYQDQLKSVYDWKCVLLGSSASSSGNNGGFSADAIQGRGFFLGMGRLKVFRLTPSSGHRYYYKPLVVIMKYVPCQARRFAVRTPFPASQ